MGYVIFDKDVIDVSSNYNSTSTTFIYPHIHEQYLSKYAYIDPTMDHSISIFIYIDKIIEHIYLSSPIVCIHLIEGYALC